MRTFTFSLYFLLITLLGQSQSTWVNFTSVDPSKPKVTLMASTNQNIRYRVEIPGMNEERVTIKGETFQRLSIPGGQKWVTLVILSFPQSENYLQFPNVAE